METIFYKKGYKYQLFLDYPVNVSIYPRQDILTQFASLTQKGLLTIHAGYAWDGASGPAIDTKNFMRGALVHDALYQLIRTGFIGEDWRKAADKELHKICLEDGMSRIRAWWVYRAVRLGGGPSAKPEHEPKVHAAPSMPDQRLPLI